MESGSGYSDSEDDNANSLRSKPSNHSLGESLDQTGFLLERLKELKAWQKEQELKLLRDHQEQIERLQLGVPGYLEDVDDDATIDQDVSSLTSFEEPPGKFAHIASVHYDNGTNNEDSDDGSLPPRLDNNVPIPSWASRTESELSQDPKTVLTRKSTLENHSSRQADNWEETDDFNSKQKLSLDERPIKATTKTFEELLAEKLEYDPPANIGTPINQNQSPAFVKRTQSEGRKSFLRKGSGLARYGGFATTPSRNGSYRRSVSTNNVAAKVDSGQSPKKAKRISSSKSCSRLNVSNNEPIKFTSKKSTPKGTNKSTARLSTANRSDSTPTGKNLRERNDNKENEKKTNLSEPSNLFKPLVLKSKNPLRHSKRSFDVEAHEDELSSSSVHDSVEISFREKLKKADKKHKKELEDLVAFEMLEEAACDSSFCSSSSKVKSLINSQKLPSPIKNGSLPKSATSTPKPLDSKSEKLNGDVANFFPKRGNAVTNHDGSESEDNTLKDDDKAIHRQSSPESFNYESDGWCSIVSEDEDSEEEKENNVEKKLQNHVQFNDGENRVLDFSPPRVPRNTPSYLIWSIFTKEREERKRQKALASPKKKFKTKMSKARCFSPLSKVDLQQATGQANSDIADDFQKTLLNAKLTELENEIEKFKKESIALQNGRRKLATDRRKLKEERDEFEKAKEAERKKSEEEHRRIKRDKMMLEKAQKDKRSQDQNKLSDELEETKSKLSKLQEDLDRKETKWSNALTKLQEQVKYLERENKILHEENHKLKLKGVTSKVVSQMGPKEPSNKSKPEVIPLRSSSEEKNPQAGIRSPDSGFRSNPDAQSVELNKDAQPDYGGSSTGNNHQTLMTTPRYSFSPADSLDSSVTLVSGVGNTKSAQNQPRKSISKIISQKSLDDGSTEVLYVNGNRKIVSPDKQSVKVFYYNGDVKETLPSGLVKYFYSQTKTWHFTYPDKKEVLQFENGQEEIRYPDGNLQIAFPDGSLKKIAPDASEVMSFPDGTRVEVLANGDRTLYLTNGQKEIHTSEFKRREYPDGSTKTLYNDGRQETRYANGRVRIKNKEGHLLHDSHSEDQPNAHEISAQ